jgi:hypothetical protein
MAKTSKKDRYVVTLSGEAHKVVAVLAAQEETTQFDMASRLVVMASKIYPKK